VAVEPTGAISKRVLEPMERVSETLFGLIMVLTFTGALTAATAGTADVRTMLIAALGCNLAWGVIDGGMYLMGCLHERGRKVMALRAVRDTTDTALAQRMIATALPPKIAELLPVDQLARLHRELQRLPEPPRYATLERRDWIGATGVCLLVFLATLPVLVPFMLIGDARLALRVSNAVAIAMLFLCGWAFGQCAGLHRLAAGLAMVFVGLALVALAIALGG
jgi:hypothetical protein